MTTIIDARLTRLEMARLLRVLRDYRRNFDTYYNECMIIFRKEPYTLKIEKFLGAYRQYMKKAPMRPSLEQDWIEITPAENGYVRIQADFGFGVLTLGAVNHQLSRYRGIPEFAEHRNILISAANKLDTLTTIGTGIHEPRKARPH